jgi:hypothetical protein
MPYNENSCGKYFIKNGEIFQCIGYCPHPTLMFENVKTGEKEHRAVNCIIIQNFKELEEKKCQ